MEKWKTRSIANNYKKLAHWNLPIESYERWLLRLFYLGWIVTNYFKKDMFIVNVGIELLEISPGYAKAKLEVEEKHLNALKTVQGGVLFTLSDIAFAAAINAHGSSAVLINANMSFVKAATKGTLIAEAKETSIIPKLPHIM